MFQLRRILLSGLVALLMVGMVTAGDVGSVALPGDNVEGGIGIQTGVWNETHTECFQAPAAECFKLWISFDLAWLKAIFA